MSTHQVAACARVCPWHSLNHRAVVLCSQTQQRQHDVEVTLLGDINAMTVYTRASVMIVLVCAVAGAAFVGVAKRLSLGWRILLGTCACPNTRLSYSIIVRFRSTSAMNFNRACSYQARRSSHVQFPHQLRAKQLVGKHQ